MKKLIAKLLIILLVPAFIASVNFYIDPLQYYRKATTYFPRFYDQQRYQAAAIARTFDYDTVVIGTSLFEILRIEYFKEKYSANAVRLTMSAATAHEENLATNLAIGTGKVNHVIWDLNFVSFTNEKDSVRNAGTPFPHYLYNQNPVDDILYLLDPITMQHTWLILQEPLQYNSLIAQNELQTLNYWAPWHNYGEAKVWESFNNRMNGDDANSPYVEVDDISLINENFDTNVLPIVEDNPDVIFSFVFPPISILEHVIYSEQCIFEQEMQFRKHVFETLNKYPNAKIYDLQVAEYVVQFDYYKDTAHYNSEIADVIVDTVMTSSPVTTPEFAKNQARLIELVEEYRGTSN